MDKLFSVNIKYLQKIESKEINIFGFVGRIASVAAALPVWWAPGLESARPSSTGDKGAFLSHSWNISLLPPPNTRILPLQIHS